MSTFLKNYLVQVYDFPTDQVVDVENEQDIVDKFKSKKISAIFTESPYVKVFLNKHCKDYTAATAAYKFGGMGFVFQKGAPIGRDFSEAILTLAENGRLQALEEYWLTPSNKCSNNSPSPDTESLTLDKFWGLYVICAVTSTICLGLALLKKYFHKHYHFKEVAIQLPQRDVIAKSDDDNNSDLNKVPRCGRVLRNGNIITLNKSATFGGSVIQGVRRRNSPRLESVIISDELRNPQRTQSASQ
ncbi:hypothetical protein TSUD_384680 [Trifolium subterraneum]|uniref:Uncharacterized protein n=1 Tax=Trifolium subterraneum TaxID=3900 RepID=A0A2Z6NUI1_TRISU|nr:hypothetical protein TSUD_384680 [Trifolium subterraneum]